MCVVLVRANMGGYLVAKTTATQSAVRLVDRATCLVEAGHELVPNMIIAEGQGMKLQGKETQYGSGGRKCGGTIGGLQHDRWQ